MSEKVGQFELSELLGGYEIINKPVDKLPQDVASAIGNINSSILGATFQPIWYVGKQVVNGVNHFFIAEEIRATKDRDTAIVGIIINIPPGEGAIKGEGAKIVRIIEEEKLSSEVQASFETVTKSLIGTSYKAIAYLGSQVVKGVNHAVICQAKTIYPGAVPYAVVMTFNVFQGRTSLVSIVPLADRQVFGYAFTW